MATVLVTGASRGIGEAVALAFAAEPDARIVLMARTRPRLERLAERCRSLGADALALPCDVTDDEALGVCARAVHSRFGAVDVLVNNAGSFAPGGVAETPPATFREQIDINLTSAYVVTHLFLPPMLEAGRGTIFFMGSVASIKGYPRGVSYGAAKHGLLGLARSLREEVRERGIRVTTLLPGATYTDSWAASGLPAERFIPASDVARTVVDIARLDARTVVEEVLIRPQLGDI
jgi:NAD(P)-dependent dehydrogenase (short-subunit alcohol dehydrogenase family)